MDIKFQDYKKLVDMWSWKWASRCGYLDEVEDVKSYGYLIFCKAVRAYDEELGNKFSTYLVECLRDLYNYIQRERRYSRRLPLDGKDIRMLTERDDRIFNPTIITPGRVVDEALLYYDTFVETLERVESVIELSEDAQVVLAYILKADYYIPGVRYKAFKTSTAAWFKRQEEFGWGFTRVKKAWNEIQAWWLNEPFAEAAV